MTDKERKDKLLSIILLETEKHYKKMDTDLVIESVDFLLELEGIKTITDEERKRNIDKIPFKNH